VRALGVVFVVTKQELVDQLLVTGKIGLDFLNLFLGEDSLLFRAFDNFINKLSMYRVFLQKYLLHFCTMLSQFIDLI
jgi:hypothetical protein